MIAVLVERMLPAALADDPQQDQLAGMHVRIAVVGLVRILAGVVRIHVVRHGAAVDHEVGRVIRLGRDVQLQPARSVQAQLASLATCLGLAMNPGIDFGELEQILAVIAGVGWS